MSQLMSFLGTRDLKATFAALDKSQAIIEFKPDGTIVTANANFLNAMGYTLDEVRGKHHGMFVDAAYRDSAEYREFWAKLNRGEFQAEEFMRIAKGGKEVWIQASYNPIMGAGGRPFKIVKYATDITAQALQSADHRGQIAAIGKAQAVIEFNLDGTIITANANFLGAMGYALAEIQGKHHSMFVEARHRDSAEYREFWAKLNRGEHQAAEYMRIGKGGKEVWIQASYNPIMDGKGRPFKVVKFATDVTQQKLQNADVQGQLAAIGKSQAVIEFNLDGTIITANPNFLGAMGYVLAEVQGKHHSMFVDAGYRDSAEYREFWARLNRGEYQAAEYKRIGKGGKEVWIQASYNPIQDMKGQPFKVVKYATDVTQQVVARMQKDGALKTINTNLGEIDQAISNANSQSVAASSASQQTSASVQAVAGGVEEMRTSVQNIAEYMVKSKNESDIAFDKVASADQATQRLAGAAQSMDGIVKLIEGIAGQINLLALNATIESARAGEAGRGFAVVASEVKSLAKQAADATKQISQEIAAMQSVTSDVVGGLTTIKQSIAAVREYVTSSAGAVEEQSAAAREMSNNMQAAAVAVAEITESISQIAAATQQADSSTKEVRQAAKALAA